MNPGIDKVASVLGISKGMVIANKKELVVKTNSIDDNYLSTLEIPIIEGRNFYPQSAADSAGSVIVNEAFEKAAGWDNAVGHELLNLDDHLPRTII